MATAVQTYRIEGTMIGVAPSRPGATGGPPQPPLVLGRARSHAGLEGFRVEACFHTRNGPGLLGSAFTGQVHEMRPVHDLDSLDQLVEVLAAL